MNLQTMTPERIVRKEAFKRTLPSMVLSESGVDHRTGGVGAYDVENYDELKFELYTQSDFLREFDVNSHAINSMKYYPNPIMKDNTKLYQKIKSRVAIAFQERIFTKRLTTLTGNNIALRIANADAGKPEQRLLSIFREGWEMKNIENAIYEAIVSDGKTGDAAICFYLDKGTIGWRSFSFEKGDTLYPHYDPITGKLSVFGRKYAAFDEEGINIVKYLDVWDNTHYARYRMDNDKTGWVVEQPATPHNFKRIPIAYDRYGEPFWANSQSLIDAYELAMSQLCENNMAYALRILYAFGAEMDMKSTLDGTPTQINSVSTDAKVGFLEPADASNSFTLQLTTLEKNIMRCSFAVETPEIKSGADMSSLTVKMLFADSYQKALEDAMHFQPFLDDVVELFKYGYGIELGRTSDLEMFKVKSEMIPYIFMSDQEVVSNIVQGVSVKALSRKAANDQFYQMGYCGINDYDVMGQEEHDALVAEAGTVAQTTIPNDVNSMRNGE